MEQADLLSYAIQTLDELEIPYALIGSFASSVWGESRFTQDIDLLIRLQPNQVSALCEAFPESEFYLSRTAAQDAVARNGQFNVIHPASGNKIDFMIGVRSDWTKSQLERGKRVQLLPGLEATVAAPEDVVLGKLVYYHEGGSDKHLRDISGIFKFSNNLIDRAYIADWAAKLGIADVWRDTLQRIQQQ